jgi:hypothetical protein
VAELAPRPDVPSAVRKLPSGPCLTPRPPADPAPAPLPATFRPIVAALAPQRYRVQLTIGQDTQEKLRRLQSLLRREIPDGDPAAIFDRAIGLLQKVEREKVGAAQRPRPNPAIRPGTDEDAAEGPLSPRAVSRAVKRAVWVRDGGRCAYVARDGRRCDERAFLEFHHQRPYALRGRATVDNIALRCRRHNQYEAELVFAAPAPRRGTRAVSPSAAAPTVHAP